MTGVGIIMTRLFGVDYDVGVFVGLSGVLLCSFLGGMKSITWTQVAQYIILIIAYLVPVTMLSLKFTGIPISELMYGQALRQVTDIERQLQLSNYVEPFKQALSNASCDRQLPRSSALPAAGAGRRTRPGSARRGSSWR